MRRERSGSGRAATIGAVALLAVFAAAWLAFGSPGRDRPSSKRATACEPPFHAGRWPGACWRPYGEKSPFNQPLPDRPRVSPDSDRVVRTLTRDGGPADLSLGTAGTSSDWDHPTYWARSGDPVFTLRCIERSWGRCEIEGDRIRIPDDARPTAGGDGHMTVVDPDHEWEYDLYKVADKPTGGGTLELRFGGRTRIAGDDATGLGSDATAAHFGLLAGVIRAEELRAGEIRHALFVRADCDNGRFVYPAFGRGARCPDPTDAPAEGARFQLAMSDAEIDALPAPEYKRAILRAMARYGFFVGDTGGSPWDVVLESGATYTSFGHEDRWLSVAKRSGASRSSKGRYFLDLAGGVDWARRLRLIDPCVTRRTC